MDSFELKTSSLRPSRQEALFEDRNEGQSVTGSLLGTAGLS